MSLDPNVCRERAQELRTAAEQMDNEKARYGLLKAAKVYEGMANSIERSRHMMMKLSSRAAVRR